MKLLSLFAVILFTTNSFAHGKGFCISPEGAEALLQHALENNDNIKSSYAVNEGMAYLNDFLPLTKYENYYTGDYTFSFGISDGNYGSGGTVYMISKIKINCGGEITLSEEQTDKDDYN